MKRELLPQFLFLVVYFLLVMLVKRWFSVIYVVFWIGGVVGMLLPYLDHLLYIYFLRPNDEVSNKVKLLFKEKRYKSAFAFFISREGGATRKVFHSAYFQAIFLLLTLLVITSSGSTFGTGLVLGFALHLLVTQLKDFMETKSINNWFEKLEITLDREKQVWYLGINTALLLIFGLLL